MNYNKLKFIASQKKVPLSHLANDLGFTEPGFYSMIKNDTMKVKTLEKIAQLLDVSPCEFFENDSLSNFVAERAGTYSNANTIINTQNKVIDLLTSLDNYLT